MNQANKTIETNGNDESIVRSDAAIKPRKMHFDFDSVQDAYWYDGNAILTAYFTALSATFPLANKSLSTRLGIIVTRSLTQP